MIREGYERQAQGLQMLENAVQNSSLSTLPALLRGLCLHSEFANVMTGVSVKAEPRDAGPQVKTEPDTGTNFDYIYMYMYMKIFLNLHTRTCNTSIFVVKLIYDLFMVQMRLKQVKVGLATRTRWLPLQWMKVHVDLEGHKILLVSLVSILQ